jgi:WD40 repeat protein
MGTLRLRQTDAVTSLAWSADGKTLVAGDLSGTARSWDATTGAKTYVLVKDGDGRFVAFSRDGKKLAAAGRRYGLIKLWDMPGATMAAVLSGPETVEHSALALSPDGSTVAVGDGQGHTVVWDVPGHRIKYTIDKAPAGVLAFSPDGMLLASGDESVHLWEARTGKPLKKLDKPVNNTPGSWPVTLSLAFSPDGKMLAAGSMDRTVYLWDVSTGQRLRELDVWDQDLPYVPARGMVSSLAFSPDSKMLAGGGYPGSVRFWDVATGDTVREIRGCGGSIRAVAFSPDGKRLVTAGDSRAMHIWDVATGKEALPFRAHQDAVLSVAFSPDGKTLASRGGDLTVRLWHVATGKERRQIAFAAGKGLFLGADPRSMGLGPSVAFSPDGKSLAALGDITSGVYPNQVHVWDLASGVKLLDLGEPSGRALSVAFSPDGQTVVSCGDEGVYLWSATSGQQVSLFDRLGGAPKGEWLDAATCASFSPDGRTVAAAGSMIRFWDRASGKPVREIADPQGGLGIRFVAYSRNGQILATCGGARGDVIRLWEAITGAPILQIRSDGGQLGSVAFSPDGRALASGGSLDKTVRVWSIFTGEQLAKFEGHLGAVNSVAFSPDGQLLASGSADTTVLLWDLRGVPARPPTADLDAKRFDELWADLQGHDAGRAYRAIPILAGAGDKGIVLFKERVSPVPEPEPERVQKLLADLDSNDFEVRRAAARELQVFERSIEPALRQKLADNPSAEARRQLEVLLKDLTAGPSGGRQLARLRALQVLEWVGSPAARDVLKGLAGGARGADLTREAGAALERLGRRQAEP